ncbi:MAG: hypothetical protein QME75_08875 [Deltaproteobacteria bacterium]|nr:hypothetical protein [Deltaproteobacteria bacterium]
MKRKVQGLRSACALPALLLALAIISIPSDLLAVEGSLEARLVNKKPLEEAGPGSFFVGQVQVTHPDGTQKLLDHWSYMEPQVVGDRVVFLPTEGLKLTRIFFYDPKTGKTDSFRLPHDMDRVSGSPSFSPDGDMLAYYLPNEQRVVVRAWPSLRLLRKSDRHPVRPGEVPPMPPVWTSPDKVQFDPLFFQPEQPVSFDLAK